MKRVELYYDFSCPYAYLASTQIEALCARVGAELVWKPVLLGGVFRGIGAPDAPSMPPPKARLNLLDMHRWADWYGVPLNMPETHPNRTVLALRATLAAGREMPRATRALYRAYWALGRDVSKPEVVREALDDAGLDGADLVRRADDQAIKDDLRARTDEAVARGVFGVPTMFVTTGAGDASDASGEARTEVFWGQDRLHLVEAALGGEAPAPPADAARVDGRVVDFFFDFSSPFAYLASTQIESVARRAGARVRWRPFLLGALFKVVGTPDVPLFAMPAAKQALAGKDMMRWAAHYGVRLQFPSRFPMSSVKALRMVLQVPDEARAPLVHALFQAAWVQDRDIADDAVLAAIATDAGHDGAALVAGTKSDGVKALLKQATDDAVAAGLCGAPSFLVGDLLFWGQDRLAFVERALTGWRPRGG